MSAGGDITVLIAVRGGSTRVPRKNIRAFAGSSMLEIKVKHNWLVVKVMSHQKTFAYITAVFMRVKSICLKSQVDVSLH